jgi:hypothetical protein
MADLDHASSSSAPADAPAASDSTGNPASLFSSLASLGKPMGFNLTDDQLRMVLATGYFNPPVGAPAPGGAPAPALSADATAANIPMFVASGPASTPSRESILNLFPTVPRATILEIVRFEFHPYNLHKLDPSAQAKAADIRLNTLDLEDGHFTVRPKTGSAKDYPTFASLLDPLLVYFDILGVYAASSGNNANTLAILRGSHAYCAHLSALSRTYTFSSVLTYHVTYFLSRAREMSTGDFSGWTQIDGQLLHRHFSVGDLRSSSSSANSKSKPAGTSTGSTSSSKTPVSLQTCFQFNKGNCSGDKCPAGRIHKCQKCDSTDHGSHACKKST